MFTLEGKRALITGGGSGIGLAMAKAFVAAGAEVIICGRRENLLNEAAATIGPRCKGFALDVNDLASLPGAVQKMNQQFGPIHILVNNAGINLKKPTLEVTDEEFAKIQQANVFGLFSLTREVMRGMAERKSGVVLNITSMAAMYGLPRVAAYATSKAGVWGLTEELASEFGPMGIRVNAIAPGFIFSEMTAKALDADPDRKAKVMGRTPLGRMGKPEEVAAAAVFLCSDAASFITGVNLAVDGGNSIGF